MGVADFDIGDQLGEGAFGQVCLCMLRTTGMQYAIKIIEVIHAKRHGGLQQVKTERDVLILLNHPRCLHRHPSTLLPCDGFRRPNLLPRVRSIVKLHFTFHDTEHLYIVTELASGGELFGHIKRLGSCHSWFERPYAVSSLKTCHDLRSSLQAAPKTRILRFRHQVSHQLRALADGRASERVGVYARDGGGASRPEAREHSAR